MTAGCATPTYTEDTQLGTKVGAFIASEDQARMSGGVFGSHIGALPTT